MIFKKILGVGLAIVLSFGFATGVFANDVTKSDDVTATINGGGFDLETAPIQSFGNLTIKIDDEKYATGFTRDFVVKDLRGLDDDWKLTVSATSLKSATHEFENVLSISPLEKIEREGNTASNAIPTKILQTEHVLDDGDVLIAESKNGSGLGQFSLRFPKDALHLMVSPEMKAGTYESTLTWNLLSVP